MIKLSNEMRLQFISHVFCKGKTIKEAADNLDIIRMQLEYAPSFGMRTDERRRKGSNLKDSDLTPRPKF